MREGEDPVLEDHEGAGDALRLHLTPEAVDAVQKGRRHQYTVGPQHPMELGERPAVQRGMAAGSDMGEDYAALSDEEKARRRALLYNQRARPAPG